MSLCLPTPADVARLLRLLDAYDRDAIWLRVRHVYHLSIQPDQISFDVLDVDGTVLRDRWGRIQRQTWQALTPDLHVAYGDQVHVCRHGDGVRVRYLALLAELHVEQSFTQEEWATGA